MGLFKIKKEDDKKDVNTIKNNVIGKQSDSEMVNNSQINTQNLNSNVLNTNNTSNNSNNSNTNKFVNPFNNSNFRSNKDSFNFNSPNNFLIGQEPPTPSPNNPFSENSPSPFQNNQNSNVIQTQDSGSNFQTDNLNMTLENSQGAPSKEEIEEMIEEIIEKVIDEKISGAISSIKKVLSWKESVETEMATVKGDIVSIKDNFDRLEKRVLGKINDYDKNILDVNSEIKALEKVFQKITPTLVNNVNELSRITKELKSTTKKEDGNLE